MAREWFREVTELPGGYEIVLVGKGKIIFLKIKSNLDINVIKLHF